MKNQKEPTNKAEKSNTGNTLSNRNTNSQDQTVHSEELRFKNADDIYE